MANYSSVLDQIEDLISRRDYKSAMKQSINLRSLALEGLHYFQTYDWLVLMTTVTLGYIGWMVFIILHVLQSYSSLVETIYEKKSHVAHLCKNSKKVRNSWTFVPYFLVIIIYFFKEKEKWLQRHCWSNCKSWGYYFHHCRSTEDIKLFLNWTYTLIFSLFWVESMLSIDPLLQLFCSYLL